MAIATIEARRHFGVVTRIVNHTSKNDDYFFSYRHPALGGGFGPGFKVAGGYDVVNNDSDPMDDNGHGTLVAGIVAADADSFKGVAPHAILYAYKALDAAGRGLDSDIIAAIEQVVDPDQNGDDADRLDIVNASLGSAAGNPTDPSSIAVNNAIDLSRRRSPGKFVGCIPHPAANAHYNTPPFWGFSHNASGRIRYIVGVNRIEQPLLQAD